MEKRPDQQFPRAMRFMEENQAQKLVSVPVFSLALLTDRKSVV